jgi:hypothetical protein
LVCTSSLRDHDAERAVRLALLHKLSVRDSVSTLVACSQERARVHAPQDRSAYPDAGEITDAPTDQLALEFLPARPANSVPAFRR